MAKEDNRSAFLRRIRRGREFEEWERAQWTPEEREELSFEAPTYWKGKRGRIDIRLIDEEAGYIVVVELKATNWDKMKPHRIRPNALRHARQIWRYVEFELEYSDVIPAIVYPAPPRTPGRKEEIEAILNDQLIQVVWREKRDTASG